MNLSIANPGEVRLPTVIAAQNVRGSALNQQPTTREAASQLVSQLFFVPMLEAMRELPFGKEIGFGGRTEEVFGEHLDQRLADKIAKADRSGLVDLVERKIDQRGRGEQAQEVNGPGTERVGWDVATVVRGTGNDGASETSQQRVADGRRVLESGA